MQPSVVPSGNRQTLHDEQTAGNRRRGVRRSEKGHFEPSQIELAKSEPAFQESLEGVTPANQIPPDFDTPRKFANFVPINFTDSRLAR